MKNDWPPQTLWHWIKCVPRHLLVYITLLPAIAFLIAALVLYQGLRGSEAVKSSQQENEVLSEEITKLESDKALLAQQLKNNESGVELWMNRYDSRGKNISELEAKLENANSEIANLKKSLAARPPAPKKPMKLTRAQFGRLIREGMSVAQVLKVRKPDKTSASGSRQTFHYHDATYDPITGKIDNLVQVSIRNGFVHDIHY